MRQNSPHFVPTCFIGTSCRQPTSQAEGKMEGLADLSPIPPFKISSLFNSIFRGGLSELWLARAEEGQGCDPRVGPS